MKTTEHDFAVFQEGCEKYIQKLGLIDWSVHFAHKHVNDAYALTLTDNGGRVATITLSTYWDGLRPKTAQQINRLALHEVLHILMAPLTKEAKDRYTMPYVLEEMEHDIIRRLENIV